jgi:GTP-binding protein Era
MQEKMMTDTPETDASPAEPQGPTRSGFVALIGAPNAGKSTLMNQLVGAKVSIVSHKVQTTRAIVRGIAIHDRTQIVFIDTPGIFTPKRRLDRAMVTTAWGGAKDGDLVLVLIDAERGIKGDAEALLDSLAERQGRTILVINKIDQVKRDTLLALTAHSREGQVRRDLHDLGTQRLGLQGPDGLPAQKRCRKGRGTIRKTRSPICRCASWRPRSPARSCYLRLHQELPYASHVETESWEEKKDGSVRIEQVIYVERDSQKKIVLGHKGETIKAIGQASRKEISEILEQKVHLFLFVKVRENWGNDPERYREMGLEFPH